MLLSLVIIVDPAEATQTVQHPHALWTRNASIYEVNIRQNTPEGTIAAFEKHPIAWRGYGNAAFYRMLMRLKQSHPALVNGVSAQTLPAWGLCHR